MKEPIFELYNPYKDESIKIFDNGNTEQTENFAELKYSCIINRVPIKELETWNAAIEAAANVAEINSAANIRKLKRSVSVGKSEISKELDDAIIDELNNGPKGIIK